MRNVYRNFVAAMAVGLTCAGSACHAWAAGPTAPVGVVSHIKILSDKVPDISSLEAWKKSYIKPGMTDKEKAMAVFNTEVAFQNADAPPKEFLQREDVLLDPIKLFNVYGYTMCSISSANIACLARYAGLRARNCTVQNHTLPELFYDNSWHMLDGDLIEYYPKADGEIASIPEMVAGIDAWLKTHPDFSVNLNAKQARYKWMSQHNWRAEGPEVLRRNPFYSANGWLPDGDFAWGDTMQQFSKISNMWESCYSMGYEVNVQLRPGEILTRNWFNKGLYLNKDLGEGPPASLNAVVGKGELKYSPKWGDLAPGRVGNGTLEYDVPLASGVFRGGALAADNLASKSADGNGPAVRVKDPAKPGVLEIRMPSSYVYLGGEMSFTAAVGGGAQISVECSDNNGLDWKPVTTVTASGDQKIDLAPFNYRRYCYCIRFTMQGKKTGLDSLKFVNDIENSQRALPALGQGVNKIAFSVGKPEGTITIEGALDLPAKDNGKQLRWTDFHPRIDGLSNSFSTNGAGSATFPVTTPGDMTRIRISDYFISQATDGMFLIEVSFDNGKTWKTVDHPAQNDLWQTGRKFVARYVTDSDVPPRIRSALVRYRAVGAGTKMMCNARIDADYKEPAGGFAPVEVTYLWQEGGVDKKDVHIAKSPDETYTIKCDAKPVLKSIVLELAK